MPPKKFKAHPTPCFSTSLQANKTLFPLLPHAPPNNPHFFMQPLLPHTASLSDTTSHTCCSCRSKAALRTAHP